MLTVASVATFLIFILSYIIEYLDIREAEAERKRGDVDK